MSKYRIDNREAVAYTIFKYTGGSRDRALGIISEFEELVPSLTKILAKKWRRPSKAKATS